MIEILFTIIIAISAIGIFAFSSLRAQEPPKLPTARDSVIARLKEIAKTPSMIPKEKYVSCYFVAYNSQQPLQIDRINIGEEYKWNKFKNNYSYSSPDNSGNFNAHKFHNRTTSYICPVCSQETEYTEYFGYSWLTSIAKFYFNTDCLFRTSDINIFNSYKSKLSFKDFTFIKDINISINDNAFCHNCNSNLENLSFPVVYFEAKNDSIYYKYELNREYISTLNTNNNINYYCHTCNKHTYYLKETGFEFSNDSIKITNLNSNTFTNLSNLIQYYSEITSNSKYRLNSMDISLDKSKLCQSCNILDSLYISVNVNYSNENITIKNISPDQKKMDQLKSFITGKNYNFQPHIACRFFGVNLENFYKAKK